MRFWPTTRCPRGPEAQTLYNGLQAFLVDMAQYLQVYHTDQPGGETEVDASGMYAKPWGTLGTASVADVAVTCTALDVPIDACTGAGTPTGLTMPNPNMQRIANMPSLRHGDGGYDQDTAAEWHIPVSSTTALEVAFSLIPEVDGDGIGTAPIWASCTINDNATTPDTAAIFQIALDSKAVCDNLAQSVAASRLRPTGLLSRRETTPAINSFGPNTNGDVGMQICFRRAVTAICKRDRAAALAGAALAAICCAALWCWAEPVEAPPPPPLFGHE